MNLLRRASSLWAALEAIVYASAGLGLFIGLFVFLPFSLVRDLFPAHPAPALALAAVSLLTIGGLVRDLTRRRWSKLSMAVLGLWFLCVLFVAALG